MKIDGKIIAEALSYKLRKKITLLTKRNIYPHLAVILLGDNRLSLSYVRQKQLFGKKLGIKITILKGKSPKDLTHLTNKLCNDKSIQGIIIQRPLPFRIDKKYLDELVPPYKDVDGFHPKSDYIPPIAQAIFTVLDYIKNKKRISYSLIKWLKNQKILIIGRGETAGTPIMEELNRRKIEYISANSKTDNLKKLCKKANIILSCVGKPNIVRHHMIKKNTILIGVGLYRRYQKLCTDYNQKEINKKVAYYTPVPGGVGPVNVAFLFNNLIKACEKRSN